MAGCVPDLQLYLLAVNLKGAETKVHANGGEQVALELVVDETNQQGGFADTRAADENYLELFVVCFLHLSYYYYDEL